MRVFKSQIFADEQEIERMEKELTEKFGERCVVLPAFMDAIDEKRLYLCDRRACVNCHPEVCSHTSDIRHAKNFVLVEDQFWMEGKK